MPSESEKRAAVEMTYALGAASRLTGISPALLRAWERRYGIVEPLRTEGGTRRYRASDLEHLRLVKAAVDSGHRISSVARMDEAELRRLAAGRPEPLPAVDQVLDALGRLDGAEVERLLTVQISTLGPVSFARDFAVPLLQEVGERWADDRLCVASEHLASSLLRVLLGSALRPGANARFGPRILFATPAGERHELGLLVAALTAMGAGANPLYLGPDLPVEELVGAVLRTRADVLALSLITLPARQALASVEAIRAGLPAEVALWVGGARADEIQLPEGVERMSNLTLLERRIGMAIARNQPKP